MTLTFENIPAPVIDALQKKAVQEGRGLEDVALDAMARGLGVSGGRKRRDLSKYRGKWVEDGETDAALEAFRKVDLEMWR